MCWDHAYYIHIPLTPLLWLTGAGSLDYAPTPSPGSCTYTSTHSPGSCTYTSTPSPVSCTYTSTHSPGSCTYTFPWIMHLHIYAFPWIVHLHIPLDRAPANSPGSCTCKFPWIMHLQIPLDCAPANSPGSCICTSPGSCTYTFPWIMHIHIPLDHAPTHSPGSCTYTLPWIMHINIPLDHTHSPGSCIYTFPWIMHLHIPLDHAPTHSPGSFTYTFPRPLWCDRWWQAHVLCVSPQVKVPFELRLNVSDTQFVVVENSTSLDTNAVILKVIFLWGSLAAELTSELNLCVTCWCGKYGFPVHSLGQVLSLCDLLLSCTFCHDQCTVPLSLHGQQQHYGVGYCWLGADHRGVAVHLLNSVDAQVLNSVDVQELNSVDVQVLISVDVQVLNSVEWCWCMCKCWTVLMYKCWTVVMYVQAMNSVDVQILNSVDVQMLNNVDVRMLNSVDIQELNNVYVKVLNSVDVQVLNSVNVLVLTSTVRSWQSTGILMSKCWVVLVCRYWQELLAVGRTLGCWHTSIEWHCWLFTEHSGVDVQASVVRQSVDLQPGVAGGVLLLPDGRGRHSAVHHRPHDHQHWAERQPAPWAEAHHRLHCRGAAGSARDSAEAAVAGGERGCYSCRQLLLEVRGCYSCMLGGEGLLQLYAGWWGDVTAVCWVVRGVVTAVRWVVLEGVYYGPQRKWCSVTNGRGIVWHLHLVLIEVTVGTGFA